MTPTSDVVLLSEDKQLLNEALHKLEQDLGVLSANFQTEGEFLAMEHNAKIIAVDSRIAGNRGLQCCGELKQNQLLEGISIILLSEDDDIDAKLKALASGCDRFIHYPTQKELLSEEFHKTLHKQVIIQEARQSNRLNFQAQDLMDIHRFFDLCFRCENLTDLSEAFMSTLAPLSLDCCLYLKHAMAECTKDALGEISEEDLLVLKNLLQKPEVNPLGFSLSISFIGTSAIIRSMPVTNIRMYDYIKQMLTVMLHALSIRVQALEFRALHSLETGVSQQILAISEQIFSQMSFELMSNHRTATEGKQTLTQHLAAVLNNENVSINGKAEILDAVVDYTDKVIEGLSTSAKLGSNRFQELAQEIQSTFNSGTTVDRAQYLKNLRNQGKH
jgi:FixJ family two-component response regulator